MKRVRTVFVFLVAGLIGSAFGAVVPTGTNLATGQGLSTDCHYGSVATADYFDSTNLIDGTRTNATQAEAYTNTWASCQASQEHFVAVGFTTPKTVGSVAIFWAYNQNQADYMASQQVDVSVFNNGAWTAITSVYPTQGETGYSDSLTVVGWAPAVSADSVKISVPADMNNGGYPTVLWIAEFEIYAATGTVGISAVSPATAEGLVISSQQQKGATRFNVALPQQGKYNLAVYDVAGKNVWTHQGASSSQQVSWNHGDVSGVYMAVLNQNGQRQAHRFLVR